MDTLKDKVRDLIAQNNLSIAEAKAAYYNLANEASCAKHDADVAGDADKGRQCERLQFALEWVGDRYDDLLKTKSKLEKLVAYEKQSV